MSDLELGHAGTDQAPSADPELARYRLYEAVAEWLRYAAEQRRLVFVLDDLYWSTEGTLSMLGHLVRSPKCGEVVFVATRSDTDTSHQPVRFAADMAREGPHLHLGVLGLDLAAVTALVDDPDQAARIVDLTDGNAFWRFGFHGGVGVMVASRAQFGLPA